MKYVNVHPKVNVKEDVWEQFGLVCSMKGFSKVEGISMAVEDFVRRYKGELLKFQAALQKEDAKNVETVAQTMIEIRAEIELLESKLRTLEKEHGQ